MTKVKRCVCYDVSFFEILKLSKKHNTKKIEDLQKFQEFGLHCGMCVPYVEGMLKTEEIFSIK